MRSSSKAWQPAAVAAAVLFLAAAASADPPYSDREELLDSTPPHAAASLLPYGKAVRDAYFQFAPGTIYFNHGGYGATPRPVQQAMLGYAQQMECV